MHQFVPRLTQPKILAISQHPGQEPEPYLTIIKRQPPDFLFLEVYPFCRVPSEPPFSMIEIVREAAEAGVAMLFLPTGVIPPCDGEETSCVREIAGEMGAYLDSALFSQSAEVAAFLHSCWQQSGGDKLHVLAELKREYSGRHVIAAPSEIRWTFRD